MNDHESLPLVRDILYVLYIRNNCFLLGWKQQLQFGVLQSLAFIKLRKGHYHLSVQ